MTFSRPGNGRENVVVALLLVETLGLKIGVLMTLIGFVVAAIWKNWACCLAGVAVIAVSIVICLVASILAGPRRRKHGEGNR